MQDKYNYKYSTMQNKYDTKSHKNTKYNDWPLNCIQNIILLQK